MEYRTLGRTGLKVSPLGLGTSNFGDVTPEDEARRIIEGTLDAGVNLIDLGHIYGDGLAERIVGSVLKQTGLIVELTGID
ncbi:MAG: aldo/keto reductase, partial [Holophagales bacterium]|nr:aldo/keto reductase [Holophagales bacterium]